MERLDFSSYQYCYGLQSEINLKEISSLFFNRSVHFGIRKDL